jgi:hypothetical protein
VFSFDRRSLAKLRLLIDRLNSLPSLPPLDVDKKAIADTHDKRSDRNLSEIAEEEPLRFVGANTPKKSGPSKLS